MTPTLLARRIKKTRVAKTLWPSQPGTLKLMRRYGDALLCVRYRHDATGLRRYTTVEIVVDEAPVNPRTDLRLFWVTIPYSQTNVAQLRAEALKQGARWDSRSRRWLMRGALVKKLGLESCATPHRQEHPSPRTGMIVPPKK